MRGDDGSLIRGRGSRFYRMFGSWAVFLLALVPTCTELAETGEFPTTSRAIITDLVVTTLVIALAFVIRRSHHELYRLATTDALTGLQNRRKFNEDLIDEVKRAERQGTQLLLAIVDVDGFKQINDTRGHLYGDHVLRKVADACRTSVRRHVDTCYRIGGDEFAIVLPLPSVERCDVSAAQVRRRLESMRDHSVSVGLAALAPTERPEALVSRADQVMYACKRARTARTARERQTLNLRVLH